MSAQDDVRYEPDERPAHILSVGLGFQAAMLTLAGIVLTPAIVIRVANQGESYLNWAVFAALVISGLSTILQAVRVGRFGAGHILIMGTSGAFIAVCVAALVEGGAGPAGYPYRHLGGVSSSHWLPDSPYYGASSRRSWPVR